MKLDDLLREMESGAGLYAQGVEGWEPWKVFVTPENVLRIIAALRKAQKAVALYEVVPDLHDAGISIEYDADCACPGCSAEHKLSYLIPSARVILAALKKRTKALEALQGSPSLSMTKRIVAQALEEECT